MKRELVWALTSPYVQAGEQTFNAGLLGQSPLPHRLRSSWKAQGQAEHYWQPNDTSRILLLKHPHKIKGKKKKSPQNTELQHTEVHCSITWSLQDFGYRSVAFEHNQLAGIDKSHLYWVDLFVKGHQ